MSVDKWVGEGEGGDPMSYVKGPGLELEGPMFGVWGAGLGRFHV